MSQKTMASSLMYMCYGTSKNEPSYEKTNNMVSEQVR